ncbi:MAG TPA: hypothetical protein VJS15_04625 [Allosphingosinicella sp.]|nr:hypothetical protein [Allosphingosinicella sp.]
MRAIAGIIIGLIVGFAATILIGIIGIGATYSAPPGMEATNPRQVLEAFAGMSQGPQIALMLAWFGGGLVGALVAKLIARKGWAAWTVAVLIAAYVVMNMLVLPLPGWMQALSVAAPLIGGLIANHLVKGARPAAEAGGGGGSEVGNG